MTIHMLQEVVRVAPDMKKQIDEVMKIRKFKTRADTLRYILNIGINAYLRYGSPPLP